MSNATETRPIIPGETPVESAGPKLLYWHVWTDDVGATHQTRCELSAFHMQSMGDRAAPQWTITSSAPMAPYSSPRCRSAGSANGTAIRSHSGLCRCRAAGSSRPPTGRVSKWGPAKLLRWRPERENRQRRTAGHRSGTVGDAPAFLMVVQLNEERWVAARPGAFL